MKLWHSLPTPRLSQLQEQALAFLQLRNVNFDVQQIFYFDIRKITGQPALKAELEELGLYNHIVSVAVHVLPPTRQQLIHVDSVKVHKYSYNIPVLNCENSQITYYTSSRPAISVLDHHHSTQPGNNQAVTYQQYDPDYCEVIDKFTMTVPTIISTLQPHNVQQDFPQLRVALLCRIGLKADLSHFGLDNNI